MAPAKQSARKPARKTAKKPAKPLATRKLSASHKQALAQGRTMSATVNRYLAAINTPKRRGRKVTRATLEQRLVQARARAKDAIGVDKVVAAQAVRDLERKLAETGEGNGADLKTLEAEFVKVAKKFSDARGISYASWRDSGVAADVLKRAGVARTRG